MCATLYLWDTVPSFGRIGILFRDLRSEYVVPIACPTDDGSYDSSGENWRALFVDKVPSLLPLEGQSYSSVHFTPPAWPSSDPIWEVTEQKWRALYLGGRVLSALYRSFHSNDFLQRHSCHMSRMIWNRYKSGRHLSIMKGTLYGGQSTISATIRGVFAIMNGSLRGG